MITLITFFITEEILFNWISDHVPITGFLILTFWLASRIRGIASENEIRFEKIDHRFEKVEMRLENVERKCDELSDRVAKVEEKVTSIDKRLIAIETKLDLVLEYLAPRGFPKP